MPPAYRVHDLVQQNLTIQAHKTERTLTFMRNHSEDHILIPGVGFNFQKPEARFDFRKPGAEIESHPWFEKVKSHPRFAEIESHPSLRKLNSTPVSRN